ncbi:DUF3307 domain-containing protein [Phaeobacter gallaeciensis]|uniref:DUF3307 domain-containing protein n=2 Tax=Alphaproteobacteria TaxID=28211 RepID=UPI00237F5673|nr:DUF3307 domain-containing protein [Phaeobacter gallaeciensis]MDE4153991.1 DUF3307 domain-containing protein [Phaeobacter gallaeciensis]MDE4270812.1 DUF3307 domain-containing protein [Phaeobacter gallaeciensis]MDE4278753.1 DUF3307 domain-containing protein [Phaeobacter gallaeciensis]MDE4283059.1 DUF3307 domain-containing protein [Phaeobacter gallaeciensis]MDE4366550.1 DUF3307 domain-containing protein [Phaeobacter gallaeciensis]
MPEHTGTLLLLLCLMQVKHMFADFFLQTPKMLSGRGEYLHSGRAQHAGVHTLGSILVFVLMGAPVLFILITCVLEWIVHFNIDYCKARYSDSKQLTPQQAAFWRAAGTDQALHQLTYIAMAAAWLKYAT